MSTGFLLNSKENISIFLSGGDNMKGTSVSQKGPSCTYENLSSRRGGGKEIFKKIFLTDRHIQAMMVLSHSASELKSCAGKPTRDPSSSPRTRVRDRYSL